MGIVVYLGHFANIKATKISIHPTAIGGGVLHSEDTTKLTQ